MHLSKSTVCAAALAAGLLLPTFRVSAQDDAPVAAGKGTPSVAAPAAPPEGGPGGPGGPGKGMEDFRQRMNERLKTALKASDEEWSVIQPLLEKVQDKTRDSMMTRFGGMMGGRGGGPGGERRRDRGGDAKGGDNKGGDNADKPQGGQGGPGGERRRDFRPQPSGEATALETALQDDNATVSDIKGKLATLRTQRQKANTELEAARADLKKVLNMRQEAVLVLAGMLD